MAFDGQGGCRDVDAIPALVGKAAFGPDGSKIAFHVDRSAQILDTQFAQPKPSQDLGVYVFDRKSKQITPVVNTKGASNYYPTFVSNDELAFIRAKHADYKTQTSVELVRLRSNPGTHCRGCDASDDLRYAAAVLGQMYGARCGLHELQMENALVGLQGVDSKSCRNFVTHLSREDLADEPTVAGIVSEAKPQLRPTNRFAEIIRGVRRYFTTPPPEKPARIALKFNARRAPKQISREDLTGICDRLEVGVIDSGGAGAGR